MKRWQIVLAAGGVLLLSAWGLHKKGWISVVHQEQGVPCQIQTADPMDTTAGWRYRQHLPHHWRYIVLQN
jgi:hypothetical protein